MAMTGTILLFRPMIRNRSPALENASSYIVPKPMKAHAEKVARRSL
jgi:hypothetical protein